MMYKFFAQLLLTTVFLNMFPVDARDLEHLTSSKNNYSISSYTAMSLPAAYLPVAQDSEKPPKKIKPSSLGIVTTGISAIVVDRKSKQVLFEKNIDEQRAIGSMTKLMTALVFLKTNPNLSLPASLEQTDFRSGGTQHLDLAQQATVKDILYASLISSDNTATASLARLANMTLEEFVQKMNETAKDLGMTQTVFEDSTGLSANNKSVVFDLVKLLSAAADNEIIRDATEHSMYTITTASEKTYTLKSTDELLGSIVNKDPYHIIAAKTGYLPEAGYCLGSVLGKSNAGDIIVVVLGSDSNSNRFQDVKSLAVWTYNTFDWSL